MAEAIAICGNRCDTCPAHQSNAETLGSEDLAAGWVRYRGFGVFVPGVGCRGCPSGAGGDPDCPVRTCASGRGLSSCGDCREPSCDSLLGALTIFERARQA